MKHTCNGVISSSSLYLASNLPLSNNFCIITVSPNLDNCMISSSKGGAGASNPLTPGRLSSSTLVPLTDSLGGAADAFAFPVPVSATVAAVDDVAPDPVLLRSVDEELFPPRLWPVDPLGLPCAVGGLIIGEMPRYPLPSAVGEFVVCFAPQFGTQRVCL